MTETKLNRRFLGNTSVHVKQMTRSRTIQRDKYPNVVVQPSEPHFREKPAKLTFREDFLSKHAHDEDETGQEESSPLNNIIKQELRNSKIQVP